MENSIQQATTIENQQDDKLQALIDAYGQSKEDLLSFLLGYAKEHADSPEHFDRIMLEFLETMRRKYIQ